MLAIITDSTCDLPADELRDLNVRRVPLYVHFKGETYKDWLEVSPGDSMPYRFIRPATPCAAGPCSTKSCAASPGDESFGRTPLYAGASAPSRRPGQ